MTRVCIHGGPRIIIPKGFLFDGASIPRPLWGVLSPTGLLLIPELIHDFGYRCDYLWAREVDGTLYKYGKGRGQHFWDTIFNDIRIPPNLKDKHGPSRLVFQTDFFNP